MGVRIWVVWSVGVLAYAVAVLERTTFGVAGIDAARRFGAPAGVVALFVVLQLLVYALMQVPVGVLLDRFGSRTMISVGALVMFLGQVALAFADSVPSGIVARILVGAGDAMTFGSVVRLVPAWFPPRRVPLMTQMTGMTGQAGQILSAVPFAAGLHLLGWRPAFLGTAAAALLSCVLAAAAVRDVPPGHVRPRPGAGEDALLAQVRLVWAHPGTRLGMWTHYTTCFSPMVFSMMWGFPYLTAGEGLPGPTASLLMTVFVLAGLAFGPTLGVLTQRHPLRRSNLAFVVVALDVIPWLAVLLWPGRAPIALLVLLVVGLASGGPGSAIGFDFARSFVPAQRLGTANGIVIMGGFGGALLGILLTGLVLDLVSGGGYSLGGFRVALAAQLPLFVVGLVGMFLSRRKVRAHMAAEGVHVTPFVPEVRRRVARRLGR